MGKFPLTGARVAPGLVGLDQIIDCRLPDSNGSAQADNGEVTGRDEFVNGAERDGEL